LAAPEAGVDVFLADLLTSCLRGALPPVVTPGVFRADCFVLAIRWVLKIIYFYRQKRRETGVSALFAGKYTLQGLSAILSGGKIFIPKTGLCLAINWPAQVLSGLLLALFVVASALV